LSGRKFSKVRGAIAEIGITQEELARKIGITGVSLSSKLNGKTQFTLLEVELISKALGKDSDIFLSEKLSSTQLKGKNIVGN